MRIGRRRPTRYVLVPGPVSMPGLRPRTRATRSVGSAVLGKSGSIQLMPLREPRKQLEDAGKTPALGAGSEQQVLADREGREDPAPLGRERQPPPGDAIGGPAMDRLAVEDDAPGARRGEAHDAADHG